MERYITYILEHPILGVILVVLLASLAFTIVRRLFKIAVGIGIIIIALAIVLHFFGVDALPEEGKNILNEMTD